MIRARESTSSCLSSYRFTWPEAPVGTGVLLGSRPGANPGQGIDRRGTIGHTCNAGETGKTDVRDCGFSMSYTYSCHLPREVKLGRFHMDLSHGGGGSDRSHGAGSTTDPSSVRCTTNDRSNCRQRDHLTTPAMTGNVTRPPTPPSGLPRASASQPASWRPRTHTPSERTATRRQLRVSLTNRVLDGHWFPRPHWCGFP